MPDLRARVRDALAAAGSVPDDDVIEELAVHAAAIEEKARAEGLSASEADRRVEELIETWRAEAVRLRRPPRRQPAVAPPSPAQHMWAGLAQDARYGVRILARQPGFALVAMLTIALGIGASTTLFSVTYGVLLRPLPWTEADRLVRISESRQGHQPRIRGTITNGTYIAWHEQPATIEDLGGWRIVSTTAVVGGSEDATRLQIASVTPSLFTVLRAAPLRGRVLIEDDAPPGGSAPARDVIVLSYGLWQERFGGRDDAIGAVVHVAGKPLTVVGVMPRDFGFPDRETRAWTPWAVASVIGEQGSRRIAIFSAMARLRPGVTPAQAAAEGTSRARSAPDPGLAAVAMFGGNGPAEITAVPAVEMMTAEVKPALLLLFAAVWLLWLTASANVASLQLARASARRREMAIRAAIGAGTARLTRQLVVESALIGAGGGVAGLLLAVLLHGALPWILPADFPRAGDVTVDLRVMLFTLAVTVGSSIACAVLPAINARRLHLVESLSDDAGAPVGIGLRSPAARARTVIMIGQIAVSCVLLVGAALLARSFLARMQADRGYDPTHLLTARIPLGADFPMERRGQLLETLVGRLRTAPGVTTVAYGNALPLLTAGGFRAFKMRAASDPAQEVDVNAMQRVVSPDYFAALGLRVLAGRPFAASDVMTSQSVIVVNRSFAARYLGDNPLDRIVPNLGMCRGDDDRWRVVGVVEDMRQGALSDPPQPELFLPYAQVGCAAAVPDPIIVIRSSDEPSKLVPALRSALREEAPFAALDSVMTMEDRVTTSIARPRLYAVVLSGFGLFALVIAGVGLFGVLSYSTAQRAREIGVRTALGAGPVSVVMLVLREALVMAIAGLGVGLAAAFGAVRWISSELYGVSQHDAAVFAGASLLVVLIAAIACIVPAIRALRTDPVRVLRA